MLALSKKMRGLLPEEINGLSAVLYDRVAAPGFSPFYRKVTSEVLSKLAAGRILDVGTGPGRLLSEIAERNPRLQLCGADLSRKMLRLASTRHKASGFSQVRFVRANVIDLPFSDETFDLVLSTASLHHWRNPAAGMRECLRVIRPGGSCWIYDLRTDVGWRTHAKKIPGGWLRRHLLGLLFRFHGVRPDAFSEDKLNQWLNGADVRVEVNETYLKLIMDKPPTGSA
jgi:ubiquinone/menaquinone biosynthesis C-methylase UbiE